RLAAAAGDGQLEPEGRDALRPRSGPAAAGGPPLRLRGSPTGGRRRRHRGGVHPEGQRRPHPGQGDRPVSALDPRTPVLVGVGQVTNRGDDLVDPITLAAEATRLALADCGAQLSVDTIAMPGVLAPRTENAAHRLAAALGMAPRRLLS